MKKMTKIGLFVLLILSLLVGSLGCTGTTITSIEWLKLPATEYQMNTAITSEVEAKKLLAFEIKVTMSDNSTASIDQTKVSGITNFSVNTAGTRTAMVTYQRFVLAFTYTVVDKDATLQGNGKNEPYLISNAWQFSQILLGTQADPTKAQFLEANYKLTGDVDLSLLPEAYQLNLFIQRNGKFPIFAGTIDGGKYTGQGEYTGSNWKLMNYMAPAVNATDATLTTTVSQPGLFYLLGNCTFKNIDVVNFKTNNSSAKGAGFFGFGQYGPKIAEINDKCTEIVDHVNLITYNFENINIIDCYMNSDKNSSAFVGYTYYNTDVNVRNCTIDNKTKLLGVREIGGFVGSTSGEIANSYTFINCSNAATMSAGNLGALIGNSTQVDGKAFTATNCRYTGSMYRTTKIEKGAGAVAADLFVENPWCHNINMTVSGSSSVGATFFSPVGSETSNTRWKKDIVTIGATIVDPNGEIVVPNVAGATRYVATYSLYINLSRYAISESFESKDMIAGSYKTKFVKPTAFYLAATATTQGITQDLTKGIIVVPASFSESFVNKANKIIYEVIAYNDKDIPVGSCSGTYLTPFNGYDKVNDAK